MRVIETAEAMREWSRGQRRQGKRIGLVPTMGALHEGHMSLVRAAVAANDATVVSVFVNPAQFAPNEDFDRYPRTFERDKALCDEAGADVVYAPDARAMYPDGYATHVNVEGVTERLCGASRPTFFRGVTTVVAKLFNAVEPDQAYFGQKDAQQAAVIRRMTRDLDFGIRIVEMPIAREPDGLAMSSRNRYLSPGERTRALALSRGLRRAESMLGAGERRAGVLCQAVRGEMRDTEIDYVEVVDPETIQPVERVDGPVLLAVAARVGDTRLIDNIKYTPSESISPDGSKVNRKE